MPYKIDVMRKKRVVRLAFFGDSDSEEHKQSRQEAAKLCHKKGFTRVLVDLTEQKSLMSGSTIDLFEFGAGFKDDPYPENTKIAAVNESDPKPDVDFVVTVASNRGITTQLFNNTDKALAWLLS